MEIEDRIKLFNGDCLKIMKDIPDKSIDMILCDLPYGTTACKWDSIIPFEPLWEQYNRIIKDNGAIVLFGSQPFTSKIINSNISCFKEELIWNKIKPTGFQMSKYRHLKQHENIIVFSKSPATYVKNKNSMKFYPQGLIDCDRTIKNYTDKSEASISGGSTKGDIKNTKTNFPKSIINIFNNNKNRLHPCEKPTELLEYLIKTYTNEGDLVLDNTMGSGSTGVACVNTNRKFIGIEKDDTYFEIASERIEDTYKTKNKLFPKTLNQH